MTFLPVVERELRVASRRRGTYRTRFLAGLAGVVIAAWIVAAYHGSEREIGGAVFRTEAWLVFFYAAIAGTLATSDSLSEEKREGTLGLLFLTDLRGSDVVLGKLAATSIDAIYGMFAFLPILTLPLLIGGVTRMEILRVVLVALNLLFLFLSIGLAASAVSRRDGQAYGLALLTSIALVAFWPVASQLGRSPNPNPHAAMLSTPAFSCFLAFDDLFNRAPADRSDFWMNVAVTQLYAWFFFGAACVITPRSWKEGGWRWKWNFFRSDGNRRARAALLDSNPFVWRVLRRGRQLAWLSLLPVAVLWLWMDRLFRVDLFDMGKDIAMLALAGLILKIALALTAGRVIAEDRRSGGLELVLTTALGAEGVLAGHRKALWRLFAQPIGALVLANFIMLAMELREAPGGGTPGNDQSYIVGIHLVLAAFLIADALALSEAAMWRGLTARKPGRAGLIALLQILALPAIIFVVGISLNALRSSGDDSTMWWLWCLPAAGVDLFFGLTARASLSENFQIIIAEGIKRPPRAA